MRLYKDNQFYEFQARLGGYSLVAGIDEAGRGPLAGPVVASAVILPEDITLPGVRDSKKMSERAREEAFSLIKSKAIAFSLAVVSSQEIDEVNILQATHKAMKEAVLMLDPQPDYLLIDGIYPVDLPIHQRCIVKGDDLSLSISAASVLAKVYRDRIMCEYHILYPHYGFSSNKGYGTSGHIKAITRYGPCHIHRLTFKGVL
ncbi:MAG TPA: ribonuclease HII [Desulfobacteraceae bacterium]|nr:ribonuclease HII [Deltaproteobacteria bacterium]RLB22682.1 MAG: ribonuclease HII [Deltaproteobacteria bacterium]HDH87177.1 ribonuclease HII [Desulfobacteraceae bacterium]